MTHITIKNFTVIKKAKQIIKALEDYLDSGFNPPKENTSPNYPAHDYDKN